LADQGFEINEVRVTGERGKALVRGISEARRTKGADLPGLHPGFGQEINKMPCLASDGANAGRARERSGMQEHAR